MDSGIFPPGGQAEIIRAHQKDVYYAKEVENRLESVLLALFGSRRVHTWGDELEAFSRAVYYGLTTVDGTQTLGEEYCDIVQYCERRQTLPNRLTRTFLVLSHSFFPLLFKRLLPRLKRRRELARARTQAQSAQERSHQDSQSFFSALSHNSVIQSPLSPNEDSITKMSKIKIAMKEYIRILIDIVWSIQTKTLVEEIFKPFHLALFYLFGKYFHLSKRLWGVTYLSTQARLPTDYLPSYTLLGYLLFIQLGTRLLLTLRAAHSGEISGKPGKLEKSLEEKIEAAKSLSVDGKPLLETVLDTEDSSGRDEEDVEEGEKRCTLCLGRRRVPTVTECGHVFCWECIVGWAREKAECPLCRQEVSFNKLLPLYNYS